MKKIQILGSGCAKCKSLYANTEAAAKDLGIEYTLEKVTDMSEIVKTGIMATPGLMVDGVVKSSGRVPTKEEISRMIG
jgi:small redox-active disulfide protein 2